MDENDIGTVIVDCAVELHQDLGPGLLETVYEVTLAHKLKARGLSVERQVAVAISYEVRNCSDLPEVLSTITTE
ncbi:MAG: GxxExxY protein, partial [Planctomycetota bacterium]